MKSRNFRQHLLIPVLILVVTAGVVMVMHLSSPPAAKKEEAEVVHKVSVITLAPTRFTVPVHSQGEVIARTQVRLLPEVSGKIIDVSPKWNNGGYFRQGEMMLKIEDHTYRNHVARTKASLAQAQSAYVQEQGIAYVAEKEWKKRGGGEKNEAARALALREPQLKSAKAQVDAAEAELKAAELSLEKTTIKAPFDGILLKKAADIGQTIGSGQMLGEFYAVDQAEIRVPLTETQQALMDLPGLNENASISAIIRFQTDDAQIERPGRFVSTEGVLDELTKVLYGRVIIDDPYAMQDATLPPIRIGAFVQVVMTGKTLDGVFVIPGDTLRRGDMVWTVDAENKLHLQKITYLKLRQDDLVVVGGLQAGDRLAVGSLIKPSEGKLVEPVEQAAGE